MTNTQNVTGPKTQRVVIVNGDAAALEMLETVLDAGHYDVVFVESDARAYSQIKKVQPDLVILCVRMNQTDSLHVLSMLQLDDDTRAIPVLTYAMDDKAEEAAESVTEWSESAMIVAKPAAWMN